MDNIKFLSDIEAPKAIITDEINVVGRIETRNYSFDCYDLVPGTKVSKIDFSALDLIDVLYGTPDYRGDDIIYSLSDVEIYMFGSADIKFSDGSELIMNSRDKTIKYIKGEEVLYSGEVLGSNPHYYFKASGTRVFEIEAEIVEAIAPEYPTNYSLFQIDSTWRESLNGKTITESQYAGEIGDINLSYTGNTGGDVYTAGDIYANYDWDTKSGKKLATEDYVDNQVITSEYIQALFE